MPRTVRELLEEAGRDARETVAAAAKRWRQQLRERVRFLTGLKLSHRRGLEREQFLVPVRIKEGLPEPLQHLESEELPSYDEWAIELIALWRQDIEVLRSTSERLAHLCVELASLPTWEQRGAAYGEAVERTEAVAIQL